LFVQATGEDEFEAFSETETEFFTPDVDAQITFVKDADGKVNSLVVHPTGAPTECNKNVGRVKRSATRHSARAGGLRVA
jgi:hypothetical protein